MTRTPAPRPPPRDTRWHTRRLLRRVVAGLLFGLALLALLKSGLLPRSVLQGGGTTPVAGVPEVSIPTNPFTRLTQRLFPPKVDWSNDYAMVQELRRRIAADKVTPTPSACLLFIINGNDPPDATRVRVLQKHTPGCGGDPATLPDLFVVRVDRTHGTAMADAQQRGQFKPLD